MTNSQTKTRGGNVASPEDINLLADVKPLTENQEKAFKAYADGYNLFMRGTAGTGKSFIALYLALSDVIAGKYGKVIVIRSSTPSKSIGFLPGTVSKKIQAYEAPYVSMCEKLTQKDAAYSKLKRRTFLQFECTSFLRGTNIEDAIVIIDEAQNLMRNEMNTVMTRMGKNVRVIICGDAKQNDLAETSRYNVSCFAEMARVVETMPSFYTVEFTVADCVRAGVCREWIIACENMGLMS